MATAAASSASCTMTLAFARRHRMRSLLTRRICSSAASSTRKLVLYSKPGCCLCDGLKEKLNAAFSLPGLAGSPSANDSLSDVVLQVRDITSNPEWENAYQYEIPVLAKVLPDGTEEVLPRLSPRLSVELVHKRITAALK
uniref:Glutaredoxin-like protein n=1 Tax=Kalanchoe fedtschenkoi TaxID=63787 RepID=A0A7N0TT60_KALFE